MPILNNKTIFSTSFGKLFEEFTLRNMGQIAQAFTNIEKEVDYYQEHLSNYINSIFQKTSKIYENEVTILLKLLEGKLKAPKNIS